MINDYRSRSDFDNLNSRRNHPRLGVIVLVATAFFATAIYASLQIMDSSNTTEAAVETISDPVATGPSTTENPDQLVTIELPLPGLATRKEPLRESQQPAQTKDLFTKEIALPQAKQVASEPQPLSIPEKQLTNQVTAPAPDTPKEQPLDLPTVAADTAEPATEQRHENWISETVKSGDSLALIFKRLNLSPGLLHRIIHSDKRAKELANIRPGEILKVRLDDQGDLLELVHEQSPVLSLHIEPKDSGFVSRLEERPLETRTSHTSGSITNSLYQSAQEAGLDDSLIMELANIFGWDIDFALEIRAGDSFSVIYEEEYLDGEKYKNGSILAAEFINRGRVVRAVRFEDEKHQASYFSPNGKSMRKAFLRAPVDFRRISSRFSRERYHPVLGKKRPHRGVDYAAATGTPIKAAGDGKVIFRGTKGGYGRTVIIQHGQRYTTLYGHLSKYRRKVKNGSRVSQGQVIGYVGKSGLATGPHLHYEFRLNGVHRNPLTIKLPAAEPIAKKYRKAFKAKSQPILAQLDLISKTKMLAKAESQ